MGVHPIWRNFSNVRKQWGWSVQPQEMLIFSSFAFVAALNVHSGSAETIKAQA